MKTLRSFALAFLAGFIIAIGGAAFLSVSSKFLGAVLFTVGLFTICTMGLNLYTGKICYAFQNNLSYLLNALLIWLGNFCGAFIGAKLFSLTRIATISERAAELCAVKLSDSLLSVFILGFFCNILIYIAVDGYRNNPHELGKYLALFFGVSVFVMCGFEHCIANMFYISAAGMWSGRALAFILVNTLGNSAGGVFIPLIKMLTEKTQAKI